MINSFSKFGYKYNLLGARSITVFKALAASFHLSCTFPSV
jgi:hypothetical protein